MTSQSQEKRSAERGNALIYILIAVALFAALSFMLGRQTDTSEVSSLDSEKARIVANQIVSYASQAKQSMDNMMFVNGGRPEIDFTTPDEDDFNDQPTGTKIYHPDGGGLNRGTIPKQAQGIGDTNPPTGWYMGAFNNFDWSPTNEDDVLLTAHNIDQNVCGALNELIIGSADIPVLSKSSKLFLIDSETEGFGQGLNENMKTEEPGADCLECADKAMMCVRSGGAGVYSFYAVLEAR